MTVSGERRRDASLELTLPRTVEAPGIARAAITGMCRDLELAGQACQTLVLLVSEVVSNAVLHSSGPSDASISLTADARVDAVRVTVTDDGEGFVPGPRDPERVEGGYGLYLVEKAASRWAVVPGAPTRVWFEIDVG